METDVLFCVLLLILLGSIHLGCRGTHASGMARVHIFIYVLMPETHSLSSSRNGSLDGGFAGNAHSFSLGGLGGVTIPSFRSTTDHLVRLRS